MYITRVRRKRFHTESNPHPLNSVDHKNKDKPTLISYFCTYLLLNLIASYTAFCIERILT